MNRRAEGGTASNLVFPHPALRFMYPERYGISNGQTDRVGTQSLFVNPMATFVEGRTQGIKNVVVMEPGGQTDIAAVGS